MSEEKLLKGRNERDRPIEFRFPIKETSSSRGIIPGKRKSTRPKPDGHYILYVWKQAGLNQEKDQLLLAGESSSRMRVLERLRAYLRHVKPVEIPSEAYLLGTDVTKAPMDLISLLICE